MNNATGARQLFDLGKTTGSIFSGIPTKTRTISNIGTKAVLLGEAAILGKNIGVAPDISAAIVSIADKLPNILDISTGIPGMGSFIEAAINNSPELQNIASDMHNAANLGVYGSAFGLLYFLSRLGFGEKGRFEAGTNAFVWTALSVGLINEMADVLNGYGHDIMTWLPLRAFESMPETLRDKFLDADSRRGIYAGTIGAVGLGTTTMAANNLKRFIMGIPKKKQRK